MTVSADASTIDSARPAGRGVAITPTDTATTLFETCRAVYVGVTGDLIVVFARSDAEITIKAAAVGYHPLQIKRVKSTGTTATNLVALY